MLNEKIKKTILLVDDDIIIATREKNQLEQIGYQVELCLSGEEAVEIILKQESGIDLILMDIDLGSGIDGTQAAEEILKQKEIPIVFLSSHIEPELVKKTEKITSYGYVVKNAGVTILDASIKMAFKLFEAKNLYKDTFNYSINGLCIHKILFDDKNNFYDCEYISVNSAIQKHTGLPIDNLIGKTIREIYPDNEADDIINLYADVIKKGQSRTVEFYFAPTGQWYDLSIFPMDNDYFTVVVQNITEKKNAIDKLVKSEENYKKLFEDHSAVKIIVNPDTGAIKDANKSAVKYYGYDKEVLITKKIQDINTLSPEEIKIEMENARTFKKTFFEFKHKLADGSIRDVNVFSNKIILDNKEYLHSIIFDITEFRKKAKDTLTRLQSLLNILQHETNSIQEFLDYALDEAITLTKSKIGYIYFYNEEKKEFILNTWSKDVMKQCTITEPQTIYHLDKTGIWGEAVRQRKEIVLNDFSAPHSLKKGYPDGHAPLSKFLTVPVYNAKEIVAVVGLANKETDYDQDDVVQIKLLMDSVWKEVERKKAEEKIKEQLKEKEVLLKEVHHRIKNNIASIESLLMLQINSADNSDVREALQEAVTRISSMKLIYDKLLLSEDYSEMSVKNYLEDLISAAVDIFPENKSIVVSKKIEDFKLNVKILFPIGIIVNELITNAMKYAFVDRKTGSISISLLKKESKVILTVGDNGSGMPEVFLKSKKTGFGLTLVRMLTKQLNGSFSIENDKGTNFLLTFEI